MGWDSVESLRTVYDDLKRRSSSIKERAENDVSSTKDVKPVIEEESPKRSSWADVVVRGKRSTGTKE